MSLSPRGRRWGKKDGSERTNDDRHITYAPGYLLGLRRDEIFDSPTKKNAVSKFSRTPLTPKANTSSPIRIKMPLPKSDSPSLRDSSEERHQQKDENKYDKASILKELSKKSRKRSTAISRLDAENCVIEDNSVDEPGRKRRKANDVQLERETLSAFHPLSPQQMEMNVSSSPVSDKQGSGPKTRSESPVLKKPRYASASLSPIPPLSSTTSVTSMDRPFPATSWKKLILPSSKAPDIAPTDSDESNMADVAEPGDLPVLHEPKESNLESQCTGDEASGVQMRKLNTIRLPDILLDDDSASTSGGSVISIPLVSSCNTSLRSSPVSPTPKQQLLSRLRRQYTSGRSPLPGESWEKLKKRVLKDDDEQSLSPPSLSRQVSHEDMDKDHKRARARVRTYLQEFTAEEELIQKETEKKKKEESSRDAIPPLATVSLSVGQSVPITNETGDSKQHAEKLINSLVPPTQAKSDGKGAPPPYSTVTSGSTLLSSSALPQPTKQGSLLQGSGGNTNSVPGEIPQKSTSTQSLSLVPDRLTVGGAGNLLSQTAGGSVISAGVKLPGGPSTTSNHTVNQPTSGPTTTGKVAGLVNFPVGASFKLATTTSGGLSGTGNLSSSLATTNSLLTGGLPIATSQSNGCIEGIHSTSAGSTLTGGIGTGGSTLTGGLSTGGSNLTGGLSTGGSTLTGGIGTGGSTLTGGIGTGGSTLTGGIGTGGSTLAGGIGTGGSTFTGGIGTGGSTLTGGIGTGGSTLTGGIGTGGSTFTGGLSTLGSTLTGGLSTGGSTFTGGLSTGGSTLTGGIGTGGSTLTGGLSTGGSTFTGGLSTGGSTLAGGIGTLGSTLTGGIGTGGSTLTGGIGTGGSTLAGGIGTGGSTLTGGIGTSGSSFTGGLNLSSGGSIFSGGLNMAGNTGGGGLSLGGTTGGRGLGMGGTSGGGGLKLGGNTSGGGLNLGGSTGSGGLSLAGNTGGGGLNMGVGTHSQGFSNGSIFGSQGASGVGSSLQTTSQSSLFGPAGTHSSSGNQDIPKATPTGLTTQPFSSLLQSSSSLFGGNSAAQGGSITNTTPSIFGNIASNQKETGNNFSNSSFFGKPSASDSSGSIFGKNIPSTPATMFQQPGSIGQTVNFNLTAVKSGSNPNSSSTTGLGTEQNRMQGGFPFTPSPSINFTTPKNTGPPPGGMLFPSTPNFNFSANSQSSQLQASSSTAGRRHAKAVRRGGRK